MSEKILKKSQSKILNKSNQSYIGAIDVGGTKMASALFTGDGRLAFRSRFMIHQAGGQEAIEQIISLYFQLEGEARKRGRDLRALGLCVPGVVKPGSGLVWALNIKGWKDLPLVKILEKEISRPLSIISDRTAYVLGEVWKGAARGQRNVIYLAVGTGIGAGIMAEGQVIHGENDLAGAVGWMALSREFKEEYLKLGCFESEASGGAFARKAQTLIENHPEIFVEKNISGRKSEKSAVERVGEEARRGQPVALKLIEEIQDYLAMGVANLVSIFNPEVVVLGGGLFQSSGLFFEPIKKKFKLWAQPLASKKVKIVLSALGQDAALYGCARAVLEKNKVREPKR